MTGAYHLTPAEDLKVTGHVYTIHGGLTCVEVRSDGSERYWRKSPDGWWRKIPAWVDPASLSYFPWRPRLRHSCGLTSKITA